MIKSKINCIFCKILNFSKNKIIHKTKHFAVIKDINPKANNHLLFIYKYHIDNLSKININKNIFADIIKFIQNNKINKFKIINNSGELFGQTIFHLHIHLLF